MKIISRFPTIWAAAVIAVVASLGCAAPQLDERPASATPTAVAPTPIAATTIAVLGDSLSAGYGLPENEAFPAVVEGMLRGRSHDVRVLNAGVSGDTTAGGLNRLDWILQQAPEILVVELGPANYGPDYSRDFAAIYERVARDENAKLLPGFVREVGLDPRLLQPDGLHPTAEGQRRLATSLVSVLEQMLQDRDDETG
jgi:acyl-CoA thioesterase-1